jgi:hypothetical protein
MDGMWHMDVWRTLAAFARPQNFLLGFVTITDIDQVH